MKLTFFIPLLVVGKIASSQMVHWNEAADWKLYDVSTSRTRQFYSDSISYYKYANIPSDRIRFYLSAVHTIAVDQTAGIVWMGDYWATCKWHDTVRILRLSRYAGFFEDMRTGIYYEIPIEFRSSWQLYLTQTYLFAKHQEDVR